MDAKNLSIVRQSFAQTVFTHQVQEAASAAKMRDAARVKWANIFLVSAVLILLGLQANTPNNPIYSYLGAGVSVGEIIFLIIQLTFNPEQQSILHKNSALKYMGLRDKYRLLITDIMNERATKQETIARRDALQQEYQTISDLAPATGSHEYTVAQEKLNVRGAVENEQFTWSDEEIDRFLPEGLRLGGK